MNSNSPWYHTLTEWHRFVETKDRSVLIPICEEDMTFRPPPYWTVRHGRPLSTLLLKAAVSVFDDFTYHREWVQPDRFALEFSALVRGKEIKGIDLVQLSSRGLIQDVEVLARPANSIVELRLAIEAFLEASPEEGREFLKLKKAEMT